MTDLRDPLQFNDAYRRLHPLALASANRVLRDEAAAEDVVQDVFMHLWRRPAPSTRPRLADELRVHARPLAGPRPLAHPHGARLRGRALRRGGAGQPSDHESAAEPVIRRESSMKLLGALDELPTDQRDAVLLAYGRGLTAQEIARATNIPLGTAKSRVRLGLRKARESLQAAA